MVIMMNMSKEKFTCPKEQIMHKELGFAPFLSFENSMTPDIHSIESSVDQDQMASSEAS